MPLRNASSANERLGISRRAYATYFRARVAELLITVTRFFFFAPSRMYVNDVGTSETGEF